MSRNKSDFRKPWFSFRSPRFEIMSRLLGPCGPDDCSLDSHDTDLVYEYHVLRNIANNIDRRLGYIDKLVNFNKTHLEVDWLRTTMESRPGEEKVVIKGLFKNIPKPK